MPGICAEREPAQLCFAGTSAGRRVCGWFAAGLTVPPPEKLPVAAGARLQREALAPEREPGSLSILVQAATFQ